MAFYRIKFKLERCFRYLIRGQIHQAERIKKPGLQQFFPGKREMHCEVIHTAQHIKGRTGKAFFNRIPEFPIRLQKDFIAQG